MCKKVDKQMQSLLKTLMLAKALQQCNNPQQNCNQINVFNINSDQQNSRDVNFMTQNNVNNGGIQTAGQAGPRGVVAQA